MVPTFEDVVYAAARRDSSTLSGFVLMSPRLDNSGDYVLNVLHIWSGLT